MKQPKPNLSRKLWETEAQLINRLASAFNEVEQASVDRFMASGVIITITALGGRELISPVLIRDGLSHATIEAIKADLVRSYKLHTAYHSGEFRLAVAKNPPPEDDKL